MEKVTVKNLIEFRRKNERTKITYVNNLKTGDKKTDEGSGGDYWVSCLSAIRNTFRFNDDNLLDEKIDLLHEKIKVTEIKRIKDQFQRNIDILSNFTDYDFHHLKPNVDLIFLRQEKKKSIIDIKGLPIESNPCHIYTFSMNDEEAIGGIWFVAKLRGYTKSELGMFADLHRTFLSLVPQV
jgi:hypothetical protein